MNDQSIHETVTTYEDIDGGTQLAILRLMEVRSEIESLQAEAKVLTMTIEAAVHRSAMVYDAAGNPWRATVVRPDPRTSVNLDVLAARYPEIYERATKRVLDSEAFKRMAKAGVLTPAVIAETCQFTDTSPSVRLVPFTASEEDTTDE